MSHSFFKILTRHFEATPVFMIWRIDESTSSVAASPGIIYYRDRIIPTFITMTARAVWPMSVWKIKSPAVTGFPDFSPAFLCFIMEPVYDSDRLYYVQSDIIMIIDGADRIPSTGLVLKWTQYHLPAVTMVVEVFFFSMNIQSFKSRDWSRFDETA